MNFVGHAVVAGRARSEPAFAFGAMVPDLQRFARERISVVDDVLVAGVADHHRVDAAFHDSPVFKGWQRDLVAHMPSSTRGARAAAHVAVELAIDGHLLRTGDVVAYDEALEWGDGVLDGPWRELVTRMRTGDIVHAYGTADGVAARVVAVMRRRPRLAPITPDRDDLAVAVAAVTPAIVDGIAGLIDQLSRYDQR